MTINDISMQIFLTFFLQKKEVIPLTKGKEKLQFYKHKFKKKELCDNVAFIDALDIWGKNWEVKRIFKNLLVLKKIQNGIFQFLECCES